MGINLALLRYRPADTVLGARDVLAALFPRTTHTLIGSGDLVEAGFPPRGEVNVGTLHDAPLVASRDAALFNPTKLHKRYLNQALGRTLVLITQQSVYDMFAYARWVDGELCRSLSVNPVGGIWEAVGDPESFEAPFWAGERPAPADYPLPFHPLDMAEEAANALLGVRFESPPASNLRAAEEVRLDRFGREQAPNHT